MNKIIKDIEKYIPYNEQEEHDKKVMLELLNTNKNLLDRNILEYHVTASSWIVNEDYNKVLMVYHNIYDSWSWIGGHADGEEDLAKVALRELKEETGVDAAIIKYIGKSQYSFNVPEDTVEKDVHWYLMMADNYYSKPQREEYFVDSGYYKFHEAYHLLKFSNVTVIV